MGPKSVHSREFPAVWRGRVSSSSKRRPGGKVGGQTPDTGRKPKARKSAGNLADRETARNKISEAPLSLITKFLTSPEEPPRGSHQLEMCRAVGPPAYVSRRTARGVCAAGGGLYPYRSKTSFRMF